MFRLFGCLGLLLVIVAFVGCGQSPNPILVEVDVPPEIITVTKEIVTVKMEYRDRIVEVPVEKIVYVEVPVEKIVTVEVPVERIVEVEKCPVDSIKYSVEGSSLIISGQGSLTIVLQVKFQHPRWGGSEIEDALLSVTNMGGTLKVMRYDSLSFKYPALVGDFELRFDHTYYRPVALILLDQIITQIVRTKEKEVKK